MYPIGKSFLGTFIAIASFLTIFGNHTSAQVVGNQVNEPIIPVKKLRDISPEDWAYQALQNLTEAYSCELGFPDGTFRGNKAMSRYEFAAGLNSCLIQWESLFQDSNYRAFAREDLAVLLKLSQEFENELNGIQHRVGNLDNRLSQLEDKQFSTTTKLSGEVVFGLASVLTGSQDDGAEDSDRIPIFSNQVTLELETSFTGEDALAIELEASNLPDFADATGTFQGEISFSGSNENNLELDVLAYSFPVGENLEIIIGATGLAADDIAETINPLEADNGDGAISNFGGLNPIYETAEDAGIGLIYELGENIEISAGYLADPANDATEEGGIFNAPYGAIAQVKFSPYDNLDLAFTYIHSRNQSDTDAGSNLANIQSFTEDEFGEAVPTVSDNYGVEIAWEISDSIAIGAWGGLSKVTNLSTLDGQVDRGTQDIWNWAITLAFPDLGREGNLGGIVIGAEPWVTNSNIDALGEDSDLSLHLEAFYQYRLTDNIDITPGVVWITAPNNNPNNNDLIIGAIRTTFSF